MIKKILILGLGYQGKQFLKYFLKEDYEICGICKSKDTQDIIENNFGIKVYTDYKVAIEEFPCDLLVLCAYPVDIYSEVMKYCKGKQLKILSDLPVSFDTSLLQEYLERENFFPFLMETKFIFFQDFIQKQSMNIALIECTLLVFKKNLENQKKPREALIVDTQYMLNNILGADSSKLNIRYMFVKREIKDVEYIIKVHLHGGRSIIYYYSDMKGKISINMEGKSRQYKETIIFDNILKKVIFDIDNRGHFLKEEYLDSFKFILKKYQYES